MILLAWLACTDGEPVQTNIDLPTGDSGSVEDLDGPVIVHDEIASPQWIGDDIVIEATIIDEDGSVLLGQLYYRRQTSPDFESTGMIAVPDEDNLYRGKIPASDLGSAGMHYYFVAVDNSNNESQYPEPAPAEYFKFDLTE